MVKFIIVMKYGQKLQSFADNQKFVILANIVTSSWDIHKASYTTKVSENDYLSINAEIDRIKTEY